MTFLNTILNQHSQRLEQYGPDFISDEERMRWKRDWFALNYSTREPLETVCQILKTPIEKENKQC